MDKKLTLGLLLLAFSSCGHLSDSTQVQKDVAEELHTIKSEQADDAQPKVWGLDHVRSMQYYNLGEGRIIALASLLEEGEKQFECGVSSDLVKYLVETYGKPTIYLLTESHDPNSDSLIKILRYKWKNTAVISSELFVDSNKEVIIGLDLWGDKSTYKFLPESLKELIAEEILMSAENGNIHNGSYEIVFGGGFEPKYNIEGNQDGIIYFSCGFEHDS